MTTRNFDALFKPAAIALIGASNRSGTIGAVAAKNLVRAGFAGPIMMVNTRPQTVEGMATVKDVSLLPHQPDLAVITTPAAATPALISDLGARGCRAAVIISAGFGARDSALRQALRSASRPHLLRILGPNCIGFQSPSAKLNASFAHAQPEAGKIALVSQSGAILASLLDWAAGRGIGFSHVVSLGDMSDIDFGDMLDYLALDPATHSILLYVENVTQARKFMSAGRIAARGKPVIVIKAGRSTAGARAAATHTGALAGSDLVYDAAFRRAGMLRVDDLDDLFVAAEMLASSMRVKGDRLTILTNGGGAGVLAADELERLHGQLAPLLERAKAQLDHVLPAGWSRANPIDIVGDAADDRYRAAAEIALREGDQDGLLVMNCPTGVADSAASARAVIEVAAKAETPVLTCWLGEATAQASRRLFSESHIPSFQTPAQAVRAFVQLAAYRRNQDQLLETPAMSYVDGGDTARTIIHTVQAEGRAMLTETEAKAVLQAYGVPVVETLLARTSAEAGALSQRLGGRVALKIYSPDISHKSDLGGVRLDLSPETVEREAAEMAQRIAANAPQARIEGFTIQRMVATGDAAELLAGIHVDPTFGPVIVFGAGGTSTEVVGDRAIGLAPLNSALAGELISRTRIAKLLEGYRNIPPADQRAIAQVLVALSSMATQLPEIASLDINPLLASGAGVVALDARIALRPRPATDDLSITPYPAGLKLTWAIAGETITIRPVRPEDEQGLVAMAAACAPEDLRLRFLGAIHSLTHPIAARLTQIDYDREMAFVALKGVEILGVCHLLFTPEFDTANFSILVRSDRQGRGLGARLLSAALDHARSRSANTVSGETLVRNTKMIALARKMGASVRMHGEGLFTLEFALERDNAMAKSKP